MGSRICSGGAKGFSPTGTSAVSLGDAVQTVVQKVLRTIVVAIIHDLSNVSIVGGASIKTVIQADHRGRRGGRRQQKRLQACVVRVGCCDRGDGVPLLVGS